MIPFPRLHISQDTIHFNGCPSELSNESFVDSVNFSASENRNYVYDLAIGGAGVFMVISASNYPVKWYNSLDKRIIRSTNVE